MAVRVKPISKTATFARVDQGVDYQQSEAYRSVGSGVVTRVAPHSFTGGTGDAVYIKLDHPITVNGRTYSEVYYAEQKPLVKVGQRVKAGQSVMGGGGAELGFAHNSAPVAPLVGGLGAGTQQTQAGQDFLDFVSGSNQGATQDSGSYGSGAQGGSQGLAAGNPPVVPPQAVPAPSDSYIGGSSGVEMPGSVNYQIDPAAITSLWQTAANAELVSPETQQMALNAQLASGINGTQ